MGKMLLTLMVLSVMISGEMCAQNSAPPSCPLGDGWAFNSKFSDEFNGNGLNSEKWWDFNPEWVGRKPGYFFHGRMLL